MSWSEPSFLRRYRIHLIFPSLSRLGPCLYSSRSLSSRSVVEEAIFWSGLDWLDREVGPTGIGGGADSDFDVESSLGKTATLELVYYCGRHAAGSDSRFERRKCWAREGLSVRLYTYSVPLPNFIFRGILYCCPARALRRSLWHPAIV
jgi:hypothetical protein